MNKITEDMELWKFDGVTGVGIYAGGLTWLSHAPVKWRKETHGFYGEIEVLKLSEIVEQVKMNCIPIITFRWMLPRQSNTVVDILMDDVIPTKSEDDEYWDMKQNEWLVRRENADSIAKALQEIIYGDPFMYEYPPHGDISDMCAVLRKLQSEIIGYDYREPIQLGSEPLMKVEVLKDDE